MAWIKSEDLPSPEEWAAREAAKEAEARAAYTWGMATSDLAYGSHLTIFEAGRVVEEFKRSNVHPYDALPFMIRVYSLRTGRRPGVEPHEIAREIVGLIRLERTLDEGNGSS
jgi:hypothetical protein